MVGTVGAARRLGGRRALVATDAAFAVGLAVGGGLVFGALGLVGEALHPSRAVLVGVVVLAAAAAATDAAGLRVRPQIRFQVPERWRRTMPLPPAVFLYGVLLGSGLTTYVPASAAWALLALGLTLGSVTQALVIGLGLAVGRALPVLVLASVGDELTIAKRPEGLRVVRALAAVSLAAGVAAFVAGGIHAATTVASPGGDPSAAGADLAWQRPGVGGFLLSNGQTTQLPGNDPALGESLVAWRSGDAVTVAARDTLTPVLQETLPGVQKLAVSDSWLVYRAGRPDGSVRILAQVIADPSKTLIVANGRPAGQLGRPSLADDVVLFHVATTGASWITSFDLTTGERRVVRYSRSDELLNPSMVGLKLLYVHDSRCSQELRAGALGGGRERVLFELPRLAGQDAGHERGHTSQGEHLPCPNRPKPTTRMLWTTAFSDSTAYVTILQPRRGGRTTPTLVAIARK